MKQRCQLLIALFIITMPADFAQTISSQKGLTKAVFNLPEGIVRVYLPDDIRPGDLISGTVELVAAGRNATQTGRNLTALKKHVLELDGQKFPLTGAINQVQCKISYSKMLQRSLSIINSNGVTVEQMLISCVYSSGETRSISGCSIPTHALTASPMKVTGPFDGNSSNTQCNVGGKEVSVLAESPRQCIVLFPANSGGNQTVQVKENSRLICEKKITGVDMQVTTGRLSLRRGERTFIRVEIAGLQNLPDTAKLSMVNVTADVVDMQPSNSFVILLAPDSVGGGNYERSFEVQSIKPGTFAVNVDLDLPEPPLVFADNKGVDVGGIKLHPLKVDGLKNGMSDAFKKAVIEVTGNRANKYPELDGCGSCLTCIQSMLDEGKVALVGEIGKILMEHYVDLLVGKAGGALAWIKDKYDKLEKAEDIAGALADAVSKGEIQVVEFPEKLCGYCLVSAIGFYDAKTQCMDAFFYCKGSKMCCTHSLTIIHLKYCVNDDGFKKPDAGLEIDVISR